MNVELYINNQLCDIEKPSNLGVRLNKELLNPTEFTSKDTTYSYTIKLPFSKNNNKIFNYADNEEVKNKFNYNYIAQLYIDGVKIFDGKFKLTSIENNEYKGNLYIAFKKSIKEIFGDKKLNQNGEWWIDTKNNWTDTIKFYNTNAKNEIQPCIFPLTLYGLLPKSSSGFKTVYGDKISKYTDKDLMDSWTRLGMEDFMPSINVLDCVKKIFNNNGYVIDGTAFGDTRLTNLYMSYKNPSDYSGNTFNYYDSQKFRVAGSWSTDTDGKLDFFNANYGFKNEINDKTYFVCDVFGGKQNKIKTLEDSGSMITYMTDSEITKFEAGCTGSDEKFWQYSLHHIMINRSGYYRIKFKGDLFLKHNTGGPLDSNGLATIKFFNGNVTETVKYRGLSHSVNNFDTMRFELQLIRDYGDGDFNISDMTVAGFKGKPNISTDKAEELYNSKFPEENKLQIIDHSVNKNFICGLGWGNVRGGLKNPKATSQSNSMVIDRKYSWNTDFSENYKIFDNYKADKYWHYGGYWNNGTYTTGWYEKYKNDDACSITGDGYEENYCNDKLVSEADYDGNMLNYRISGNGEVSCIVYLEKGERLNIVYVTDAGEKSDYSDDYGIVCADVNYDLSCELLSEDKYLTTLSNWNYAAESANTHPLQINLINFLDSDTKTDDFINELVKCFNLRLIQTNEKTFELNSEELKIVMPKPIIDIDDRASIMNRANEPLGLPKSLKLGFTIDVDEAGYNLSNYESGGGEFNIGTIDGDTTEQTTKFSYNWYYPIKYKPDTAVTATFELPIISNYEAYKGNSDDYEEMQQKLYTQKAYRFWYYKDLLNNGSITVDKKDLCIADVINEYNTDASNILTFKNEPNTIMSNYFKLIMSNDTNYTEIETYLKPYEYEQLDGTHLVHLNGDLYYCSKIEGYEPLTGYCKLYLIRKVN